MNILVTGANGLVGTALCAVLEQGGHTLIKTVRSAAAAADVAVGHIDGHTDWSAALAKAPQAVVHLAARVHQMQDTAAEAALYRQVNTEGALNLARQCVAAGVKRFVFVSTAKVLGEGQPEPYRRDDPALPQGAYACSKWDAEQALLELGQQSALEVVILRPPLVYGPGVGANFLRLLQGVDKGLPLPFGCIRNRRSLVFLGNLVDAIACCLEHPAAVGQTYLVSDGEDLSSAELVRRMAAALGRAPRLLPVPTGLLRFAGTLLGKQAEMERLMGSLALDSAPLREELGWTPPYTLDQGLQETADWFKQQRR